MYLIHYYSPNVDLFIIFEFVHLFGGNFVCHNKNIAFCIYMLRFWQCFRILFGRFCFCKRPFLDIWRSRHICTYICCFFLFHHFHNRSCVIRLNDKHICFVFIFFCLSSFISILNSFRCRWLWTMLKDIGGAWKYWWRLWSAWHYLC